LLAIFDKFKCLSIAIIGILETKKLNFYLDQSLHLSATSFLPIMEWRKHASSKDVAGQAARTQPIRNV